MTRPLFKLSTASSQSPDALLEALGNLNASPDADPTPLLVQLVDTLRPRRADDVESATQALRALCYLLQTRADLRGHLRLAILRLFAEKKQVSLYVDSGVFPNTGFFSETARRLSRTLLPDVVSRDYLKDLLGLFFHDPADERWVEGTPDEDWLALFTLLDLAPGHSVSGAPMAPALAQLLEGLLVISYRISAIGLEPELLRVEPSIENFESPFLAQNAEMLRFLKQFEQWWREPDFQAEDDRQLQVLFDQCRSIGDRIRNRAAREGTSLSLTFHLQRLRQHLERAESLLELLREFRRERSLEAALPQAVALFKALVRAECRKNDLKTYWRQNVELLARRVTENAGRTGEHYITESRSEYFALLRSALLGGFVIAFMALNKLELAKLHLPPLTEALAFCLNYGLGFVLIHILHGTVATKQPAMTANAIAASIDEATGPGGSAKPRNLENLAGLVARTCRSQMAAIIGNIGLAIPMAMVIAFIANQLAGGHLIGPEKAEHLLADVHPWHSGAILYAGVAGVCLFLAGLIAGYYDNLAAYNRIPQRLMQLDWPKRLFGEARLWRVANYVENNLGALAGNFFFGFLLGGMTAIGTLFGLPVDIRHIAFSSAYLGYAAVALDFAMPWQTLALAGLGVAAVGLSNLAVSFSLALYVALKARQVSFAQGRHLVASLARRFWRSPGEFLLPPRALPAEESRDPAAG
ncbi:recombinase [Azospira sp. I13]|uniref:site-specific recombinase n=1 Tax=Azospira sp. I13 TaxID=1765050 RepID=UPI000D4EB796|nr:site-specific recombinase [Azospira sp. I13]GBG02752.1 recombinase [Azospira sp. I13]